ncbi:MAG: carboxymuconolactone decarboxylase family protein [Candidatus Dormibacter sp.]|uniref:carboxymuconolactone decarboxylase family protein n=1 Tax=Candidatus Dormibacter sp. TaxID=2973982 RepID=UPI000DB81328|nr:MAG: carboxymuconolactone decarboxylase [Candidatus Dormibacteraeota bacterium]
MARIPLGTSDKGLLGRLAAWYSKRKYGKVVEPLGAMSHHRGVDLAKIEGVPGWRQSEIYTDLERLVLEYTEAVTTTPPIVTDGLVARLREQLGDARMVELTELVAVENLRSRFNSALGLESQGFKAECALPQPGWAVNR